MMSSFSTPYVKRERIGLGEAASFEYADYPHFHMLYIPSLVHHEPLELLLVLRKLSELMPRLNYADDCAQYFSMGYDVNPYHVETFDSTNYVNKLPGRDDHSGIYYFYYLTGKTTLTHALEDLEARDDMQLLRKAVERPAPGGQRASSMPAWFVASDTLVQTYLMVRACDIARYGTQVADLTFPQPTRPNATPREVAEVVDRMVGLRQALWRQHEEHVERDFHAVAQDAIHRAIQNHLTVKEKERAAGLGLLGGGQIVELPDLLPRVYIGGRLIALPDHLPPRVLTPQERDQVREACLQELLHGSKDSVSAKAGLQILDEFADFYELLSQPEHYIYKRSTQRMGFVPYTTDELRKQMEHELMDLPPLTAYVKSAWKGKIHTPLFAPMSHAPLVDMRRAARQNAIDDGILRPRSVIEEEIRDRQENWRRRRGNEPPPPTSTGGNTPAIASHRTRGE